MGAVAQEPTPPRAEERAALRNSVAAFAAREGALSQVRALRGSLPGYRRALWSRLAQLGWLGVMVPEACGGSGLGVHEAAIVARGLAEVLAPEPYTAACVLAAGAIGYGDQTWLRAELLSGIASGAVLAVVAWQERPDDLDPSLPATRAEPAGGGYAIAGTKRFVAGGSGADGFVVSALAPDGPSLFWVERAARGLAVESELLADGSHAVTLQLDSVFVAAERRLASPAVAQQALARALDEARIVAGAELLGIAARALDLTLDYLRVRRQFGRPIGSFQALQHRAVDLYVQRELAAAVLDEALALLDGDVAPQARAGAASRVKARCAEAALRITREAIQMHGAMGFTDECDVGLYVKRAMVLSAWLGTAQQQRRRFARVQPLQVERTPHRETVVPAAAANLLPDSDWNALSDDDFRRLLRGFIEEHYPDELRYLPRRVRWAEVREFNLKLARRGWIAPAWPRAWGGMELSPAKQLIYADELERWGVGRAPDQGVRQLGPVLMQYGSVEQQRRYLPKILSYEHVWCQGYSEPNAGSDLASLTTAAVADGDDFVIDGRKIWTSLAMDATHIYVLCRTDASVKKQEGISFIIVDLATPGITIRPIRDIAGNEEFCEVVFDRVRAPRENLVGGLNKGWTVAKAMLGFERLGIGSPRRPLIAFNRLATLSARRGLLEDAGYLDRFTGLRLDLLDHCALYGRYAELARRGAELGPDVSILKIWGMEMFQRITEFGIEAAAADGWAAAAIAAGDEQVDLMTPFYMSRLITIGGGSNEIQRNIMAKHVLRLPG